MKPACAARTLGAAVVIAASLGIGPALAEQPPRIPDNTSPPEKIAPPLGQDKADTNSPATTGSVNKSDGVIEPRDVDPAMRAKPPVAEPGTTPVIPPSGSPTNRPSDIPK